MMHLIEFENQNKKNEPNNGYSFTDTKDPTFIFNFLFNDETLDIWSILWAELISIEADVSNPSDEVLDLRPQFGNQRKNESQPKTIVTSDGSNNHNV